MEMSYLCNVGCSMWLIQMGWYEPTIFLPSLSFIHCKVSCPYYIIVFENVKHSSCNPDAQRSMSPATKNSENPCF